MQVVERQHHGLPLGETFEQRADRPVCSEALGRGAGLIGPRIEGPKRGEHACQLGEVFGGQPLEALGIERLEKFVEGIDDESERQLALELGGAALQREPTPLAGQPEELAEDPGLADSGLPADDEEARVARTCPLEQLLDDLQFVAHAPQVGQPLQAYASPCQAYRG